MSLSKAEVFQAILEHGSQVKAARALGVTTHVLRKVVGTANIRNASRSYNTTCTITKSEVLAAVAKYGQHAKACEALGISKYRFYRIIAGGVPNGSLLNPSAAIRRRSLEEFRDTFDNDHIAPTRIKEALLALGDNGWLYESEFAKFAGVSLTVLGNFRDMFTAHIVDLLKGGRRAWAGTSECAEKMREML